MSFYTKIRDTIEAPIKAVMKFDPLYQKITTGHFTGGIKGYNARWRAAIHEVYKVDPISKKIGIKESTIFNVGRVVGVIVGTYFTAGALSGVFAGAGGTITAAGTYDTLSAAMALKKLSDQKKAKEEADKAQAVAAGQAAEAEKQAKIAEQMAQSKALTPASGGITLAMIAAVAALLM